MYTNEELKTIYEERYSGSHLANGTREVLLYRKYREMLIAKGIKHKVLDIGCGLGYKTVGFVKPDEYVLAIDLSENGIQFCNKQHKQTAIEFKALDALQVTGKYSLITAFGFSLFNTPSTERFVAMVDHFYQNNLLNEQGSVLVIGSFTDFSGNGKDSWYLHTAKDLSEIVDEVQKMLPVKVSVIFPHKKFKNYFGYGIYNFAAEAVKLLTKRKRTFFIRIEHE